MSAVATNPEMLVAPRFSSNAPKVVSRPVSSIAHFRPARKMKKLLRSNSGTCTNTIKAVVCTQKAIRNGQISVDKNDGNFLCRKCAFLRPKLRQIEHAHRKSRCEVLANFLESPARLNAQTGGKNRSKPVKTVSGPYLSSPDELESICMRFRKRRSRLTTSQQF